MAKVLESVRLPKDVVDLAREQIRISRQTLSGYISLAIEEKFAKETDKKMKPTK